jgi:hypothetical protein
VGLVSGASTLWGLLPSTFTAYILAAVWGAAMIIAGYLQGTPVLWIMMAVPLAVAAIFTAIWRASQWRGRTAMAGKFYFDGVGLGTDSTRDQTGAVNGVTAIQVRLMLRSEAELPVSYIIEKFTSSFENRIPPNAKRINDGGIAMKGERKFYSDHIIDMTGWQVKPRAEGEVKFTIKYGYPGRERHILEKNIKYFANLDPQTGFYGSPEYMDLQ